MITIPKGAYMRLRSKGRYLYAINRNPTVWEYQPGQIKPGQPVYCIAWKHGQNTLMASKVIKWTEEKEAA